MWFSGPSFEYDKGKREVGKTDKEVKEVGRLARRKT